MKLKIALAFTFLAALGTVKTVEGHAYPICIKQEGNECKGYMRHMDRCVKYKYNGCEGRPNKKHRACNAYEDPSMEKTPMYTDKFPMAKAKSGEELTMVWHPRNHANSPGDRQTGDVTTITIYMNPHKVTDVKNPQDPSEETFKQNQVATMPFGNPPYEFKGPVCDVSSDKDKGHCTGKWKVPENLQPGIYTFFVSFYI